MRRLIVACAVLTGILAFPGVSMAAAAPAPAAATLGYTVAWGTTTGNAMTAATRIAHDSGGTGCWEVGAPSFSTGLGWQVLLDCWYPNYNTSSYIPSSFSASGNTIDAAVANATIYMEKTGPGALACTIYSQTARVALGWTVSLRCYSPKLDPSYRTFALPQATSDTLNGAESAVIALFDPVYRYCTEISLSESPAIGWTVVAECYAP